MKVLIANPACRRPVGDGHERYMMGAGIRFPWSLLKPVDERPRFCVFPMFLGYAAALAESDDFEVVALDAIPLNLTEEEFLGRVAEASPDIIVMQPNALMIDDVARMLDWCKEKTGAVTILVGEHVSAETTDTFDRCSALDYAVMGEFEFGLQALLKGFATVPTHWQFKASQPDPLPGNCSQPWDSLFPLRISTGCHGRPDISSRLVRHRHERVLRRL